MTSLILVLPLLPAGPATPYDYAISIDGETVSNHGSVPLALFPPAASGAEVVALVPAQALSWHQVTLPRGTLGRAWLSDGSSPRLRNVLVGLLEERLLDEPAQLHFALAPLARDDAPVWVAACDREIGRAHV